MNGRIKYLPQQHINKEKWDDCMARASNSLVYGFSFYLDAMAKHWDGLVLNNYEAVMPLTWNKKYGIRYLYQPFCCAMLGVFGESLHSSTTQQFLEAIPDKFRYWDISLNPNNSPEAGNLPLYTRKNFILSLNRPYLQLYNGFSENIQRNIKKALGQGVTVTHPPLREVLALAKSHMRQFGNVDDEDFQRFAGLYRFLEQHKAATTYGIISTNGQLLASCIFFTWQNRSYYILAGNHPHSRQSGASHALINAFIQDHADTSMVLDFEGSDVDSLALFYRSFGSTEENYPAIQLNKLPGIIRWLKK